MGVDMRKIIIICMLSIAAIAHVKCATGSSNIVPECTIKAVTTNGSSRFELNGIPIVSAFTELEISAGTNGCILSVDQHIAPILKQLDFSVSFAQISLICSKHSPRLNVLIVDEYNQTYEHIIGHVIVHECAIEKRDMDILGRLVELKIVVIRNSTLKLRDGNGIDNLTSEGDCWIRRVALLAVSGSVITPSLGEMFACDNELPELSEMFLENMFIATLPSIIKERCVSLQSLALPSNLLTNPPNFPWTNITTHLPRNSSRTHEYNHQYTDPLDVDIVPYLYIKAFKLGGNNISDLRNYTFIGDYHIISLNDNGLEHLSTNTFRHTTGLQVINLDHNRIADLEDGSFETLDRLRKLQLNNNRLTYIRDGTLRGLNALRFINLDENYIVSISRKSFESMQSLEVLSLTGNAITFLPDHLLLGPELATIRLSDNPITTIPAYLINSRYIRSLDMRSTHVEIHDLAAFVNTIDPNQIAYTKSSSISELYAPINNRRLLDLSSSNITHLSLDNLRNGKDTLTLFLRNYVVTLTNNPILCDCDILSLRSYLKEILSHNFTGMDFYGTNWRCMFPSELRNRPIVDIDPNAIYSESNISGCPGNCTCYIRCISTEIVVDCRGRSLREIPSSAPNGSIEMWLQGNTISRIETRSYFHRLVSFDISDNIVDFIDDEAVASLKVLRRLNIAGNKLVNLPTNLQTLKSEELILNGNSFECDCHSLWMKHWIVSNTQIITDWFTIVCRTQGRKITEIVLVSDDDFVCIEPESVLKLLPYILTAIILVGLILLLVIMIYIFSHQVKYYVFVFFSIRLFHVDTSLNSETDGICLVSTNSTKRTRRGLHLAIEECGQYTKMLDIPKDFIAGLTKKANIEMVVAKTSRMIYIYSEDSILDEDCAYALKVAKDKCKSGRPDYFLLIFPTRLQSVSGDEFLQTYVTAGRYFVSKTQQLKRRVSYHIPEVCVCDNSNLHGDTSETGVGLINRMYEAVEKSIFVTHAYEDLWFFDKLSRGISVDYKLSSRFKDFSAGEVIQKDIIDLVNRSNYVIACLSNHHVVDEWTTFTFNAAYQKCISQRQCKLITIIVEPFDPALASDDIAHYVDTHACLKADDKQLMRRLRQALTFHQDSASTHDNSLNITV